MKKRIWKVLLVTSSIGIGLLLIFKKRVLKIYSSFRK